MRIHALILLFLIAGKALAAPAPQASPAPRVAAAASPSPAPQVPSDSPMDAVLSEDLIRALRDPFQLPSSAVVKKELPKSDLENLALKDFKVQGIISGPRKVRAMLSGAGGKTYFVKVGDRIGVRGGKITQITGDAIRVTEYFQDEKGRDVPDVYELRVTGDLVSLTKRDEDKR
jgi:hypothetical protein